MSDFYLVTGATTKFFNRTYFDMCEVKDNKISTVVDDCSSE
jgi:hypothetical protein